MDEHVGSTSPDQSAPPPSSYSRDQKPTWNVFNKFIDLFSNRTTAIVGVLVLTLGIVAGTVAVQRSTETRQHAASVLIPPQGPCPPLGDVNLDRKIDAVDAQLVLKYVGGITIVGTFNKQNADVDGLNGITAGDALKIQRYIVGLDTNFPACKALTPTPTKAPFPTPIPGGKLPPCYLPPTILTQLGLPTTTKRGYGDVDNNSVINENDASEISKYLGELTTFTPLQIELADIDGAPNVKSTASDVQVTDIQGIQKYTVNIIPTFPVCGATTPTPTKAPFPTPTPRPTIAPYPTPTPVPPMISPWSATPIPTK